MKYDFEGMFLLMNKFQKFCIVLLKVFIVFGLILILKNAIPTLVGIIKYSNVKTPGILLICLFSTIVGIFVTLSKLSPKLKVFILLLIATLIRIWWIVNVNSVPVSDFEGMYVSAKGLLTGDMSSFRDFGYLSRFPHLVCATLYMALMIIIFPTYHLFAMKIVNVIFSVVTIYLLYKISNYFVKSERIRLMVALIATVFPAFISYCSTYCTENIAIPLYLLTVLWFFRSIKKYNLASWFVTGILLSISDLFRGVGIIFLIAFLIYILVFNNENKLKSSLMLVLGTISTAVLVSLFLISIQIIDKPLWKGAEPSFATLLLKGSNVENGGKWNLEDANFVEVNLGKPTLAKECIEIAADRVSQLTFGQKLQFFIGKFISQWSVGDFSGTYWATLETNINLDQVTLDVFQLIYVIIVVFGIISIFKEQNSKETALLHILLCGFGLFFMIIETQSRYSYIASWIFIILAAQGIEKIVELIRGEKRSKKSIFNIKLNLKKYDVIFFAALPFFIADVILRYGVGNFLTSQLKYNVVPILFNIFWIGILIYMCCGILPENVGRKVYAVLATIFGVWFFANYVCFKILSRFLWLEDILLFSEASNYISSVINYIDLRLVLSSILYIVLTTLTFQIWHKVEFKSKFLQIIPFLICVLGLICVQTFMKLNIDKDKAVGAWEVWEKPTLVYDKFSDSNKSLGIAGFYQYTFKNLYRIFTKTENYELDESDVIDYFNNKEIKNNNMTGILEGKNVIFVLMESMDDWIISEKYTPTIKYMMDNGINFTNHYMPNMGMGYTFNAEFAANVGYYCPSSETSLSIYTKNVFPYSLGNILKNIGYRTGSFHFNTKDFYNRGTMHKRIGYDKYNCLMDYVSLEKCVQDSEIVKSDTVYKMMTDTGDSEKFLDFIITYSAHLPYNIEDNKLKGVRANYPELMDENMDEELNNIYILAHDTDEFFRVLLEKLDADGILQDTVIIGFTDHYAYGFTNQELLDDLSKEAGSEILEKVPFFIYSPQIEPCKVQKVTSAIDILPTIANLLGVEERRFYIGNDAFDENYTGLVYFADRSWYDGDTMFFAENIDEYDDEKLEYIFETNKYINQLMNINDYVIGSNYFAAH